MAEGVDRLEPDVRDILRLGVYQLLELDRIPAYAVVSEAVEAARDASGAGAGRLVNALLRRLDREANATRFPAREHDPVGYLTTWGSHPRWLIERWLQRWSVEAVERLVEYNNSRPSVYLTLIGKRERALERLAGVDLQAWPVELSPSSLRISSNEVARALESVGAVIQDPGAATVVDYAAFAPGLDVIDFCAAPGGKAAQLAARGHRVVALEVSSRRIRRLQENRARLGLERLAVVLSDSTLPPLSSAAAILIDAPCSGTGTLARHPDGRWRLDPSALERLVDVQQRLLDAAADVLRPGGLLIYSTCSLEPEENERQVEMFLERRPEFARDPPPSGSVPRPLLGPFGDLCVLPHEHDMDGAYAVRLRRSED